MTLRHAVCIVLLLTAACGGRGDANTSRRSGDSPELGAFGPPLGVLAPVVRSATLTTSGAIAGRFSGSSSDEHTGLRGQCNPGMWANFGIDLPPGDYERLQVTLTSRDAIPTGATGEFRLDSLVVEFTTKSYESLTFRGRGTLTLATHDADRGGRRMVGMMSGAKLEGNEAAAGQALDATLDFDMDFSCGVRG